MTPSPPATDRPSLARRLAAHGLVRGMLAVLATVVPLVAVDRAGTRLGQGKGHYDRVIGELKRRGALLAGVGWAVQLIDSTIPVDPWDVPLDCFASP